MKRKARRVNGCESDDHFPGVDFPDPLSDEVKARVRAAVEADGTHYILGWMYDFYVTSGQTSIAQPRPDCVAMMKLYANGVAMLHRSSGFGGRYE